MTLDALSRKEHCVAFQQKVQADHFDDFLPFLLFFFLSVTADFCLMLLSSSIRKARVILQEHGGLGEARERGESDLPFSDFVVGELSTIDATDGSLGGSDLAELSWSADRNALHFTSAGILFDVLNGELAAGGPESTETVALRSVASSSFVRDSSIQHI
jgi:hypothetical protein